MKWAILKKVRVGAWVVEGEITVNVDLIAALEEEPGAGGRYTRMTISGGRAICIAGKPADVRRKLIGGRWQTDDDPFAGTFMRDFFGMRRA